MRDMVNIREATIEDAPELARILTETNRATFRGLVPDYCLESPTLTESIRNWQRTLKPGGMEEDRFLLIAENGAGQMLGYALAGSDTNKPYESELHVLMVDTPWQRQGYGRLLVAEVAKRLQKRGSKMMLVGVEQSNPNRAFYEHLGAQPVGDKPLDWAGYQTKEFLYRWEDLDELSSLATT